VVTTIYVPRLSYLGLRARCGCTSHGTLARERVVHDSQVHFRGLTVPTNEGLADSLMVSACNASLVLHSLRNSASRRETGKDENRVSPGETSHPSC
jgi:hypothetical protein